MAELTTARAPGPRGLPLLGSLLPAWRDPLTLFLDAQARFGDIVRFDFGPLDYYLVSDPDAIRHVLVDNAKAYTKSRNYMGVKKLLGDGLLTAEGDVWRKQRKLAQPAFHRERLAGFARQMADATRDMLDRWHEEGDRAIDVHEEMVHLTFRIVGMTLFSSDVHGDAAEVGRAMNVAVEWANAYAEAVVPIPPSIPTPANLRFVRAKKTLDDVVHRIIAERRRGEPKADLLSMLMEAGEMSDEQLRDEVITMILAGHETTANLLTWTLHLLSKHPDVERRVHEEAAAGDDPRTMDLVKRVLEESMRLFPPVWVFERQATAPDVLGGFRVEKRAVVGISPYALHRHARHWENPEGFDPDRFLPSRSEGRSKYVYLPFGGGPRTCIGNHFAMMEAQIILAMILRDFRLDLDPSHPIVVEPTLTLRPKHGVRVWRRRRA